MPTAGHCYVRENKKNYLVIPFARVSGVCLLSAGSPTVLSEPFKTYMEFLK